jgi:WhiB family transcriptional regulator, redox-sensing transcriptional regulator
MPRLKPDRYVRQMADQAQWGHDAACKDDDPALFDTISTSLGTTIDDDTEAARDTCADCPVMLRCLEHAIRFDVQDGVWGGMVHEERQLWALQHHPEWMTPEARQRAAALPASAHAA